MKNNESVTNVARVRGSSCVGSDTFSSELNHIAHLWTSLSLITFPTLKTHFFSAVQIWSFPSYLVFIFTFFRFVDYIAWYCIVTTTNDQTRNLCTCYHRVMPSCPYAHAICFQIDRGVFQFPLFWACGGLQDGAVHQWRYA